MRDLNEREFKRILIIKPSSFGDVIHALPVLNGLRHRYPNAKISWMVSNSCTGLLEGHHSLDEVIPFDRKRYGMIGRNFKITVEFMEFVNSLRARNFDLIVDLQGLFRSGFLSLASGASVRVGFANAREFGWMFYTHRVAVPHKDMHAVDRYYLFGNRLGFAQVPISFDLPVHQESRARIKQILDSEGIAAGESYALIGPGTRWQTKIWPAEYFAEVAEQLESQHGLRIVLVGMDSEADIAQRVAEQAGGCIVNLVGKTKLAELIALVDGATVAVMHDSGPMHLATALGKPMVAIYGPTNPSRTGPYGRDEAVARVDLPCSPCYIKKVQDCPHHHCCMRELKPELLLQKLSHLLTHAANSS
ncbi:MAG: lipopolysaccharide heptosyltransferase I [Planctomycetota bacterium]|nr:MAG: lipopolysaccharide heptosyltransferase I [Planctomycetota bacterium]